MLIKMRNPTRRDLASELRRVLDTVPNLSTLARQLGVARDTIYKWRRGDSIPDLEMLGRIANLADATIRLEFGPEASAPPDELEGLRSLIEQNSQQIEELTKKIEWLSAQHDGDHRG